MAQQAHEKGLKLSYELKPDVPGNLVGDSVRLWQVIVNLVGNAVKFTRKGEISVLVETEKQSLDRVTLHFIVSDTGIGIRSDRLQAIFEPFVQADNSMTRHFGGTGLGLTITSRLVEMMGGRIWVESQEGQGSRFHFTVRFGRCSTAVVAPSLRPGQSGLRVVVVDDHGAKIHSVGPKAAPSIKPVAPVQRRLRILVTDDNPVNQLLSVRVLQKAGHSTAVADNGQEALDALQRETFDLVLMDVQMPVMDGFQATARIRENERKTGRHLPIVAMTAHAMKGDRERCFEAGMDGYVAKPLQTSQLFAAIAAATDHDELPEKFESTAPRHVDDRVILVTRPV